MITFIGFSVIWIISCLLLAMFINMFRASGGGWRIMRATDPITVFMQGFTFGPIGVIASFAPQQSSQGKTLPMLLGGLCGNFVFYIVYTS